MLWGRGKCSERVFDAEEAQAIHLGLSFREYVMKLVTGVQQREHPKELSGIRLSPSEAVWEDKSTVGKHISIACDSSDQLRAKIKECGQQVEAGGDDRGTSMKGEKRISKRERGK
ncbi:hypothetical protein BTVI_44330 [Pitangus sulphuratus]|nr:hypothetical protein BTVI_44330 [Pitangus sulphuratus]